MSQLNPEVATKLLELLNQVKPQSATVAVLINPANPNTGLVLEAQKRAADAMNVALEPIEVRGRDDLESAFSSMGRKVPMRCWFSRRRCSAPTPRRLPISP